MKKHEINFLQTTTIEHLQDKIPCCYDRGWDCEPEDDATKAALAILIMEYN